MGDSPAISTVVPKHQKTWFEALVLILCLGLGGMVCWWLNPMAVPSPAQADTIAMARLLADGAFVDAFRNFSVAPLYPLMLTGVILYDAAADLPTLLERFYQVQLGLYVAAIGLAHLLIRPHIRKPYSLLVSVLAAASPLTLGMAWSLAPYMLYTALSLAALVCIDRFFSKKIVFPTRLTSHVTRKELALIGTLTVLSIFTHAAGYLLLLGFFMAGIRKFGLKRSAVATGVMLLAALPQLVRDGFEVADHLERHLAPVTTLVHTAEDDGVVDAIGMEADLLMDRTTADAIGSLYLKPVYRQAGSQAVFEAHRWQWVRWFLGSLLALGLFFGMARQSGIVSLYTLPFLVVSTLLLPVDQPLSLAPVAVLMLLCLYDGVICLDGWLKKIHIPFGKYAGPVLTVWIALCALSTLLGDTPLTTSSWQLSNVSYMRPVSHVKDMAGDLAGHLSDFDRAAENEDKNAETKAGAPRVVTVSAARKPQSRLEKAQQKTARERAAEWLSRNTPKGAKVAMPRPEAASHLMDGDDAGASSEGKLRAELGRYDYLVEEGSSRFSAIGKQASDWMKLVYEDESAHVRIWQIQPH